MRGDGNAEVSVRSHPATVALRTMYVESRRTRGIAATEVHERMRNRETERASRRGIGHLPRNEGAGGPETRCL